MKPDVKKYLNVCQYLQDVYHYKKKSTSEFSYEIWARELNVSDKSYVRFMILGKRPINSKMIEAFTNYLELLGLDKKYFETLVHYTQSKTREHKDLFGKKLISYIKDEFDQIEISAQYEFLSRPLLPRLLVFFSFNDLEKTPQNLAWLLGVTTKEIEEGILKLLNLKLIESNGETYVPLKRSFKVPDQFGDLGLEAFYRDNLKSAAAAIQLPSEERRFKSLFLPLSAEEFDQYCKNLLNFTQEQLALFNSDDYADRRLYQAHFNIYPVSCRRQDYACIEQA